MRAANRAVLFLAAALAALATSSHPASAQGASYCLPLSQIAIGRYVSLRAGPLELTALPGGMVQQFAVGKASDHVGGTDPSPILVLDTGPLSIRILDGSRFERLLLRYTTNPANVRVDLMRNGQRVRSERLPPTPDGRFSSVVVDVTAQQIDEVRLSGMVMFYSVVCAK